MPGFSKQSLDKLHTCDRQLIQICSEVIKVYDFTVICGYRNKEDQDKALLGGFSKTPWPTSKHNKSPSQAVDLVPYPIDWNNIDRFRELNKHMQEAANKLNINIRWGGDFTSFKDYPHWELV